MAEPRSIPADGNVKVAWVPSLAVPASPSVAELIAGSVVDLSCYLTDDGFTPSTDEQTITDNRLCSRQTFEQPGRFQDGLQIKYVRGQTVPEDLAFTTLIRGTQGFYVVRWGIAYETAFLAAQKVDVYPSTCGVQMKQPPEANTPLRVQQKLFVTGTVQRDVLIAA